MGPRSERGGILFPTGVRIFGASTGPRIGAVWKTFSGPVGYHRLASVASRLAVVNGCIHGRWERERRDSLPTGVRIFGASTGPRIEARGRRLEVIFWSSRISSFGLCCKSSCFREWDRRKARHGLGEWNRKGVGPGSDGPWLASSELGVRHGIPVTAPWGGDVDIKTHGVVDVATGENAIPPPVEQACRRPLDLPGMILGPVYRPQPRLRCAPDHRSVDVKTHGVVDVATG